MKKTLVSEYSADIRPRTTGGLIDDLNYKEGIKTIFTNSVKETISRQADSKVLCVPAL